MERLRRALKDPLVHFLVLGGAIFAAYALLHPAVDPRSTDETTIVVDRAALVSFLEYRQSAFAPEAFQAQFAALSPQDRRRLIDAYVREEAMVREARALGMDRADYVIRQRLVQKILFLVDGAETGDVKPPSDAELERFYSAHADNYRSTGRVSFTHVFVDKAIVHPGGGEAAARALLAKLNARRAGFNDAPQYGDRWPFLRNYVGRAPETVVDQFGQGFAAALARLAPSARWQGPIESDYGWHLVLLKEREPAALPPFASMRSQVLADWQEDRRGAYRDQAIDDLLKQYTVRIMPDATAR